MVIITKLQRIFYSIQSTLSVTNTFLAASVCDSHCTGVAKPNPPCARVWVCERLEKWKATDGRRDQRLTAESCPPGLGLNYEQPGNVKKLAAKGN